MFLLRAFDSMRTEIAHVLGQNMGDQPDYFL
jgi:hypothetical protein